jgi:hypothetical protein
MSGDPGIDSDDLNDVFITSDPHGLPGKPLDTTNDGIELPSLPTTSYSYDPIIYTWNEDHKSNGSFRENFYRGDRDLNSVIVGGYILTDGPDDEISCRMGGGRPTDSDGGKAGRCYIIGLSLSGTHVRIRKMNPHPLIHQTSASVNLSLGDRRGHYTGVMGMKVNIIQNGQECVRLIGYADIAGMDDSGVFTAANQNWVKTIDVVDTGQLHDVPWLTTATPGNSQVTIRTDEQDDLSYDFRLGFAARIKGGPSY